MIDMMIKVRAKLQRLINGKEKKDMAKVYYCDPEGVEVDCPDCGEDAIVNDDGLVCSNPDCPNS